MKIPSCRDAYQALLLQAADHGRGERLFGDSLGRLREILPDFLPEEAFPDVYLEFPLAGTSFLDATVLYGSKVTKMPAVRSSAAEGTEGMLRWFFSVSGEYPDICCGYELDTKAASLPEFAFGNAKDWNPKDPLDTASDPDKLTMYLNTALPVHDAECTDCTWLPLCAGGCPHRRLTEKKACLPFRNQPERFVLALYDRIGKEKEKQGKDESGK